MATSKYLTLPTGDKMVKCRPHLYMSDAMFLATITHLKPEDQLIQISRRKQEIQLHRIVTKKCRRKTLDLPQAKAHMQLKKEQGLPVNGWPLQEE